ncbi:hypothetical protein Bbelb_130410 [Branchiostoma belcheri]|nr:hypothetical protein Bbelb_130410 [Branchiostoma belcheri]
MSMHNSTDKLRTSLLIDQLTGPRCQDRKSTTALRTASCTDDSTATIAPAAASLTQSATIAPSTDITTPFYNLYADSSLREERVKTRRHAKSFESQGYDICNPSNSQM